MIINNCGAMQEKLDHLGIIALIVGTPFTAVVVGPQQYWTAGTCSASMGRFHVHANASAGRVHGLLLLSRLRTCQAWRCLLTCTGQGP
jgi:predicted membrane channel-forming protein YqfA (hemolysin III family)